MRSLRLQLIVAGIVALFGASVALACGMVFPWQLLDNRAATLDTMPVNTRSFAWAEAHLVTSPKDNLSAVELPYSYGEPHNDALAEAVAQAEVAGLSSDQAEIVRQMRAETSGDLAFREGALLPASVRLYTAGAVDFHKGDSAKAIARFQAILDLPADERRDREVWAAYMLGRLYARAGEVAKTSKAFALTRALANNGAPDPFGLGVSSYGEEARLHLDHARRIQKAKKMSPGQRREYAHEIEAAVRLYAEQAAHGSTIGIDSLRRVTDEVLGDDSAVAASICDPLVQRLLVTRTLQGDAGVPYGFDNTPSGISQLVNSVQKCRSNNISAADQLAAIAYRDGDYRLAQNLASQSNTPLATWVKARLVMQKGNFAEAAKYYAEASKAFPSSGDVQPPNEDTLALLNGEKAVLTLARGEYVDALEQLYPYSATFWGDIAYIAERVLTVDELKTFVDTHKDMQIYPSISLDDFDLAQPPGDSAGVGGRWRFGRGRSAADQLHDLLGRRLIRAGRYQEALKYFSSPEEASSSAEVPAQVPKTTVQPKWRTTPLTVQDSPENERARVGMVGPLPLGGEYPGIIAVPAPHREGSNLGIVGGQPSRGRHPGIMMAPQVPLRELSRLSIGGGHPIVGINPGCNVVPYPPQGEQSRLGVGGRPIAGGGPGCIMALDTRAQTVPRPEVRKNISQVPKNVAADYVQALDQAKTARSNVDRARGWYRAAVLAGDFKSGSEIMGTEGPPDNYIWGVGRGELGSDDRFVTDGERRRLKVSAPKPNFRYHYLFVGVDEAVHAADLLPPRSQAFAAVLCLATRWMTDGKSCDASAADLRALPRAYDSEKPGIANPLTADLLSSDEDTERSDLTCQLYQRYLKEGAVVPWATHFGRHCPEPDFVSAASFTQTQASREARRRHLTWRHRWVVVMQLAIIAVVLGASTVWFLRHRYSPF